MKKLLLISAIIIGAFGGAAAQQGKSNDALAKQIKKLKAEKAAFSSYDDSSKASKLVIFGNDFAEDQAKRAGLDSLRFGMAFFYVGRELTAAPDLINLTFTAQTKKPRFAENHSVVITADNEIFDLGEARYVSKPNNNVEYLNFQVKREMLAKIAKADKITAKIGNFDFEFSPVQRQTFVNLIALSDPLNN